MEYSEMAETFIEFINSKEADPPNSILGCIVKEKFGELTFQNDINIHNLLYRNMWSYIEGGIEKKSLRICELTGSYGRMSQRNGGWLKVLCEEKRNELGYKVI